MSQKRIYKYPLEVESRQIVVMPVGAKILSVGTQGEVGTDKKPNSQMPVLFALIDPLVKGVEYRVLRTVTTGEYFNDEDVEFIGTTFVDWYTMHVFEVLGKAQDPIEGRFQEDMAEIREAIAA